MYIKSLHAYNFRCFGKVEMTFQYPGKPGAAGVHIPNVNLLLGSNGGGKSSILRALAIAALAPVLSESGFVAYRLVRRPGKDPKSLLKIRATLEPIEAGEKGTEAEMLARMVRRPRSSIDQLTFERTPRSPILRHLFDDRSPAFFVVGYGATRRVETGDFSASSSRKSRGRRYSRVASLFEDHVTLQPLQSWLPRVGAKRKREIVRLVDKMLPDNLSFSGRFDKAEEQYVFDFEKRQTPFPALSDGYKAFIGWLGDLLCQLNECCPKGKLLKGMGGLVLLDEVDLHLHPEWQREVVPRIARALPKLQFVMTSHSPIVVGTLQHQNLFVTETERGETVIKQLDEKVHGKNAEQLLLSSYFSMKSTRAPDFVDESEKLFQRAAIGDSNAAIEYLRKLTGDTPVGQVQPSKKPRAARVLRRRSKS